MSSGRTVKVSTKADSNPYGLSDLGPNVQGPEATVDRWAINVVNTDASNTILVGRSGIAAIPLGPGSRTGSRAVRTGTSPRTGRGTWS